MLPPLMTFCYLFLSANAQSLVTAKQPTELLLLRNGTTSECEVITIRKTQVLRGQSSALGEVHTSKLSAVSGAERYSFVSYNEDALSASAQAICGNDLGSHLWTLQGTDSQVTFAARPPVQPPHLRIQPLIQSGPSHNRVDLVFFSDGYKVEEYDKFIEDAKRLAEDVSYNQTFNTVKPLLNFWAAFTPSKESGIGVGGVPKDTAFGLYRDGTELRGVYYSKPEVARAACLSMGVQCDYPILMGNDPFYGGLGGEFTVITPSLLNGPLVLRHELGHSVIDVGEEYDGGFAYFGVNAAQNVSTPISWAHWLSNTSSPKDRSHEVREELSVMPIQAYPWTLLNTSSPWSINFSASGMYDRHLVRFSLSGLPETSDLTVEIDGTDLGWEPRRDVGIDRWHYNIYRDGGLNDGEHQVKFTLNNAEREGTAQMCSVEVLEFGDEQQFNANPGHYSLYPTFSLDNVTTYRPTNEDCLMRIVTTPDFCKVCLEGLWHNLLRRVDLVDDLTLGCEGHTRTANLTLVPLAQFRTTAVVPTESYTVTWFKGDSVLGEFANSTLLKIDDPTAFGRYAVEVNFTTGEVRVDKEGLLSSRVDFTIGQTCLHDTD